MEFPPQKMREMVLQLLFALELGGSAEAELIPLIMKELMVSKRHVRAAYEKAHLIWQQRSSLDQKIGDVSANYAFERIKTVEKSVLRLALYELLTDKEVSEKVIISEACRLTAKFSAPEACAFVNALLDNLKTVRHDSSLPLQPIHASQ